MKKRENNMAKIVSFSNQKGGVGKTTSCVNISAQIANKGKKVLMIDMDPQGNATSGLGLQKSKIKNTIYDVIIGRCDISEAIIKTKFKNLSVVPANIELAGAEIELPELEDGTNFTKLALDSVKEDYDYIFIDCPPSLGMLTVKALSVSDGVVIPMQCEFYSLEGMSQLLNTVKKIKTMYNPSLQLVGILLTMYNGRLTLTGQVVAELKKYYADKLFKVPISRTVRISEAPGYGEPICYHDPYGKGSLEYAAVAKELMLRI
jgi:chromosome partitioning protein